ncbi:MAG: PKD domain-containing protein, partial [Vicinamibacterales bacterium]
QPPGVIIAASSSTPNCGQIITLTATVTGATSTIQSFVWDLGTDAIPPTATTTGNQVTPRWTSPGTKVITVTVNQSAGPSGQGLTSVVVGGTCTD